MAALWSKARSYTAWRVESELEGQEVLFNEVTRNFRHSSGGG